MRADRLLQLFGAVHTRQAAAGGADASRWLKSGRFFTDDFRPEIFTELGIDYIETNSMLTVRRRRFLQLAPALEGVTNAFAPWKKVTGPAPV